MKNIKLYNKFLNEDHMTIDHLFNDLTGGDFDAKDIQDLLERLSGYFKDNQDTMTNMDAVGISADLKAAAEKIGKRTGN